MAFRQASDVRLEAAVEHHLGCPAVHRETVPLRDVAADATGWPSRVGIFQLIGHPEAQHCYAWWHREETEELNPRLAVVLAIPPVDSVPAAVRAYHLRMKEESKP